MGPEQSGIRPYMQDPYVIISDTPDIDNAPSSLIGNRSPQLVRTGFHASWSISPSKGIAPSARSTHFTVYNENCAFIGYGIDTNDHLLNDFWQLDLHTLKWTRLGTSEFPPRNGSTAVRTNNLIYVFGGHANREYLSDLHVINMTTGEISIPTPSNSGPSGRIGHVMQINPDGTNILIWGGYNGEWLADLWIFDIPSLTWRQVDCDIGGRTSTASVSYGESVFIFGSTSRSLPLLRFDWTTETLKVIEASGNEPPAETSASSFTAVDKYLILVGGKLEARKFCLIYAYDVERNWWFVFYVIPDGNTTSVADGRIEKGGYFMVPRIFYPSTVYVEKRRTLLVFLGAPHTEPVNIFQLELGTALGVLHLQNDMRDMYHRG